MKPTQKTPPDGADEELFDRECAYFRAYLHKTVLQGFMRGISGPGDITPERIGALIYGLVEELMGACALSNVLNGKERGTDLGKTLLRFFERGVTNRTLQLRHEVDQMVEEPAEECH